MGKLVVITGPSGVGKSTIVRQVLQRTGTDYSVSATTRKPRPGEVDGKDYRFVTDEQFDKLLADDAMLEWAEVFGRRYGTPAGPVREAIAAGRTVILEIDVQGGLQVAKKMPQGEFVLLTAPSREELARRLKGRGSEDPAAVAARLAKAEAEISAAEASGVYNRVIVNDDLERAIQAVVEIVQSGPQEAGRERELK